MKRERRRRTRRRSRGRGMRKGRRRRRRRGRRGRRKRGRRGRRKGRGCIPQVLFLHATHLLTHLDLTSSADFGLTAATSFRDSLSGVGSARRLSAEGNNVHAVPHYSMLCIRFALNLHASRHTSTLTDTHNLRLLQYYVCTVCIMLLTAIQNASRGCGGCLGMAGR